ncbi:hypothetical protein HDU77_002603 [Chytriomyces hyalinus]|nr:hypothetical protein HDU77_002603 [Chytriomyces hyalinus]
MQPVLALVAAISLASSAVADSARLRSLFSTDRNKVNNAARLRAAGEPLGNDQCPQGWTWDGNQCYSPVTWTCGAGGPNAGATVSSPDQCCTQGWTWDGKQCNSPASTGAGNGAVTWTCGVGGPNAGASVSSPEQCCTQGWTWDGKQCNSPAGASTGSSGAVSWTCGAGGPNAGATVSSPDQCCTKGWTWDGKQCNSPVVWTCGPGGPNAGATVSSPDQCCTNGWTWDGKQCYLSNAGDGVRCWNGSKAASADACPKDDIVECGKAGGVWAPSGGCSWASSIKPPGAPGDVWCWNGSKAASADACPKDDIVECGKAGGVWAPSGGCSWASSIKPPGAVSAAVTVSPTYLPVSRTGVSTKTDGSLYNSSAFTQIPGIMVAVSVLLAIF